MQDELTWKLSLLVDDELPPDEAIVLLEQIDRDPDLRFKWYRYQTIRHAIRSNGESFALGEDFLERVQSALDNEAPPSHDVARLPSADPGRFNLNTWVVIPLALAAMVVIVVLLRGRIPGDGASQTVPLVAAAPSRNAPVPVMQVAAGHPGQNPVSSAASPAPSLEDYLLVHSEDSLYQQGPQHMLSYARIISHDKH